MKFDTMEPCGSCPYRRDAKLGLWHPEEFERLAAMDRDPIGALYACHGSAKRQRQSVCAGWLLDQRRRGVPSVALRIALLRSAEAAGCITNVSSGGHALYESVEEMIAANEALGRCECGRYLSCEGRCPACVSAMRNIR